MPNAFPLPWTQINDFLLQVGAAKNLNEFNNSVCAHVEDLIPHDFPVVCLTNNRNDMLNLGIEKPNETIDPATSAVAGEQSTVTDFNSYYRFRLPVTVGYIFANLIADFRPFANTEFVIDFVRPRRIERCLGGWFRRYTLVIPRCKPALLFSERETAISKVIAPHLENFYDMLCLADEDPATARYQSFKMRAARHGLTRREQEVAFLLSERLSMRETADKLFISLRTVESHAIHIYAKLGIQRKKELAQCFSSDDDRPASRSP